MRTNGARPSGRHGQHGVRTNLVGGLEANVGRGLQTPTLILREGLKTLAYIGFKAPVAFVRDDLALRGDTVEGVIDIPIGLDSNR